MKKWKVVAQYFLRDGEEANQIIINLIANNKDELLKKTNKYFLDNFGNIIYKIVSVYEM